MTTICVTGSTDGIGLATVRALLEQGHRVLVHGRNEERGRAVVDALAGDVDLVTGDLARLADVRGLAQQLRDRGPLDVLVHNAGVWVRGDTPRTTVDGFETTLAVNVLAPHLLTALVGDLVTDRLLWLGSGMAASGAFDPATFAETAGATRDSRSAYADSKACDVALAGAWGRRLPHLASAAVDPGWVETKLASAGAPGRPEESADSLAYCCLDADLRAAPYWKGRRPIRVPSSAADPTAQDALATVCDALVAP
jgi:NAD(P)-dependent dehydrogenase (short-subunit alcohol dehydrogenase family)